MPFAETGVGMGLAVMPRVCDGEKVVILDAGAPRPCTQGASLAGLLSGLPGFEEHTKDTGKVPGRCLDAQLLALYPLLDEFIISLFHT